MYSWRNNELTLEQIKQGLIWGVEKWKKSVSTKAKDRLYTEPSRSKPYTRSNQIIY